MTSVLFYVEQLRQYGIGPIKFARFFLDHPVNNVPTNSSNFNGIALFVDRFRFVVHVK